MDVGLGSGVSLDDSEAEILLYQLLKSHMSFLSFFISL